MGVAYYYIVCMASMTHKRRSRIHKHRYGRGILEGRGVRYRTTAWFDWRGDNYRVAWQKEEDFQRTWAADCLCHVVSVGDNEPL